MVAMIGMTMVLGQPVGQGRAAVAPASPVASIAADGWRATYPTPPAAFDPVGAPETITVTRVGHDASAAQIAVAETLTLMKRVRLPYPDQSTLTADQVALSDFVYAGDTLPAGVTNNSTLDYPLPIALWLTPDLERVRTTTFRARLAVAHAYARNGRPVAAVKFIAGDGVNTVEQIVSTLSNTQSANSGLYYDYFECAIDLTTLAPATVCTLDVIICPWVGEAFQASVHGSTYPSPSFTVLKFLNDRTGSYGEAYAYVDPVSGSNATGAVSATAATAAASPYLTAAAAATAIRVFNKATYGRNTPSGGTIRLVAGTHTHANFESVQVSGGGDIPLVIEGLDPANRAATIYQDSGVSATAGRTPHKLKLRHLTLKKTAGTVILLDNGSALTTMERLMVLENVGGDQNGQSSYSSFIYKTGRFFAIDSHLISLAGAAQANIAKCMNQVGCTGATGGTGVYNTCATIGSIGPGIRTSVGNQPAAEGQLVQHCFFSQGNSGQKALELTSGAIGPRGFAVVGTVLEHFGGTTAPATFVQADDQTNPTENMVFCGNTTVGARTNWLYNDIGVAAVLKRGFMQHSVNWRYNTKTDMFDNQSSGDGPQGGRVGNWAVVFGVGHRNLAALRGADDGSTAPGVGNWLGEVQPLNSVSGSSAIPIVADWADDRSFGSANPVGGGDYTPGPASALPFIPAGQAPYSVDQKGRVVPDDGSAPVGALQSP